MIRLITSPSYQMLMQSLTKLLASLPSTTVVEKVDATATAIHQWLPEAMTPSLWSPEKVTVIYQALFFAKGSKANALKAEDEEALHNLLAHPRQDVEMIFLYQGEVDERLTSMKLIRKHHDWTNMPLPKQEEWYGLVQTWANEAKISLTPKALARLIQDTYPDLDRLYQEIQKLSVYGKQIDEAIILQLIKPNLEENVFELTNQLMAENLPAALSIFRDFQTLQVEPTLLVSILAKHFQLYAKVMYMLDQGLDTLKISQTLKIHEYRVRLMAQAKKRFPLKRIHRILLSLDHLDEAIKKGLLDKGEALSWWLVNFSKPIS